MNTCRLVPLQRFAYFWDMRKITIAIDGGSSTGKSTLAKRLANALHYIYVDTGAMYRAVTLFALQKGYIGPEGNMKMLLENLPHLTLHFVPNATLGRSELYLNGDNVEHAIRTMRVSQQVSQVAAMAEVRDMLVELQHQMGKDKGVVMDGRDIGTVVFPHAELKLFLKANLATRAKRRYAELCDTGEQVTYQEVLHNVRERDLIDSTRELAPLRKAEDAIEIDTSEMEVDELFAHVYTYAVQAIAQES